MTPFVSSINYFVSLGAVALLLVSAALLALYIYERVTKRQTHVGNQIARVALLKVLALALIGSVMALVYSDVFGFVPCGLCWLARIALFPQVIIAGGALILRDKVFAPVYLMILSGLGMIITLYHHYIQMGGSEMVGCPATGVSCAQRLIFEFGFVTFPLIAFSLFASIFVIMALQRSRVTAR